MKRSLSLPFRIERDVVVASGATLERAKVQHVLLTEPGELPWRTAFGTPLEACRHRPLDAVEAELVRVRCEDALATWLPDLAVDVTAFDAGETALGLRVSLAGGRVVEVVR
jgi:alkylhydroperoxidase family enzyme